MSHQLFSDFVDSIPSTIELRNRLAENLKERDLIRRLIRLSEQKEKLVKEPITK